MREIEREWILRAAEGDMRAFREIYDCSSGYVYTLAHRIVRNKLDADEVTQDVFLRIYKNIGSFKFDSAFKTWLYRIAVNTALNYVKKRNKTKDREVDDGEEVLTFVASNITADEKANKIEAEERLGKLLDELSPEQRACIVAREIEEMDYETIAKTLSINLNTVRTRIRRARESLMAIARKERERNEL